MSELKEIRTNAIELDSGLERSGERPSEQVVACLLGVSSELNTAKDLRSGLQGVAELLKQYIDYETLAVLLLDDLGRELRFALTVGFDHEVAKHWRFGMGQGIVGTAAQTGKIIVSDDVGNEPKYINASSNVASEIAVPLVAKGHVIGVLDVGGRTPNFFSDDDRRLFSFLGEHLANAIESARFYENMREQARTLSLLHEVSRELTSILDRAQLVRRIAELVKRLVSYDAFTVYLWDEQRQLLEPEVSIRPGGGVFTDAAATMEMAHGITGTVAALRQPIRVPNVHREPRYVACERDFEVRSELAVPLIFKDRLVGVLDLESASYDAFSNKDQQLLSTLASSLAIALENSRLYEALQQDEARLEKDLSTAREVQKQLLPTSTPWVRGVEIGVAYDPARHLGGDFYDFVPFGEGRLAVAVGDVAGKATSAALYGSLTVGTLREFAASHSSFSPGRILSDMNEKLGSLGFNNRFVALGFGVYDGARRQLTLANSGLPRPYLLRGRSVKRIDVGGVPLGLLTGKKYDEVTLDLEVGDALVMISDGVEDSLNAAEEEFGLERVEGTLQRLAAGSARDIAQGLLAANQLHAGEAEAYDDRTVLVVKVTGESDDKASH
jgi:sigma-B regulation protein RsbU (phosphoserine phosphatase)